MQRKEETSKRKDGLGGNVYLKTSRGGLRTEEERCDMKGRNTEEERCVKRKNVTP